MFSVRDRDRVRDRVLQMTASDSRVVAGAVVGSLSHDEGDRWADLDLTFAIADSLTILEVLEDWTRNLVKSNGAATGTPSTGFSGMRDYTLSLACRRRGLPTYHDGTTNPGLHPDAGFQETLLRLAPQHA